MKEIKAIIQPFMVEKVIDALAAIEALSARNPDFEAPAWRHHLLKFPHTAKFVSPQLRRPAYNVLAVLTQGETRANSL